MPDQSPTPETAESSADHPVSGRATVYQDASDEWRWRLRSPSGDIEADSGEGFPTVEQALQSFARTRTAITSPGLTVAESATAEGETTTFTAVAGVLMQRASGSGGGE